MAALPPAAPWDAPSQTPKQLGEQRLSEPELISILEGYRQEAWAGREQGTHPRDQVWEEHLNAYWGNYDFTKKAEWQSRETLPDVALAVDRFAAAMVRALTAQEKFFDIEDPTDAEHNLTNALERMMHVFLQRSARTIGGQEAGFGTTFEDLMKLGALMMSSAAVTWKVPPGKGKGYVAIDPVDPRKVWYDPTGRGLYRLRRYEIDKHDLVALAGQSDGEGKPIYNIDQVMALMDGIDGRAQREAEILKGHGSPLGPISYRKTITIDEYYCTLVRPDGSVYARNVLCLVANERFLIRGPEKNPYWHKRDWLVSTALITVPLSVYGRAYIENIAKLVKTLTDTVNLVLDGVFTSSMKAFVMTPEVLLDPSQAEGGVHPNVTFQIEQGQDPSKFLTPVDLGRMPAEVIQVIDFLQNKIKEGISFNEVGLGQFAPNSRTSATEVSSAQENSGALLESVARTIEQRLVEPILDLVWKTGVQHLEAGDTEMANVVGEMYPVLVENKQELIERKITFKARGITGLIAKASKLAGIARLFQMASQLPPQLAQGFIAKFMTPQFIENVLALLDIDMKPITETPRQQQLGQLEQQAALQATLATGGAVEPGAGTPATGSPSATQPTPQPISAPA